MKIQVNNVERSDGTPGPGLKSKVLHIRKRLLDLLLGEDVQVLVVTPGDTVRTVEIKEVRGGKRDYDKE